MFFLALTESVIRLCTNHKADQHGFNPHVSLPVCLLQLWFVLKCPDIKIVISVMAP